MLFGTFDNIIEFDSGNQMVRGVKISSELSFLPLRDIRMFSEDILPVLDGFFTFENSGQTVSNVMKEAVQSEGKELYYSFVIKEKKLEKPCMGLAISYDGVCWLCFKPSGESAVNVPRKPERFTVENVAGGTLPEIRTFGFFDVYHNGKAVLFRCEKAKELLALLVDRRGGYVSSADAVAILWPEEKADSLLLARYRKTAMRLMAILREHGIEDIVESVYGKRRIVPEKVSCDLFDYLSKGNGNGTVFHGVYMNGYSWAENTVKTLSK